MNTKGYLNLTSCSETLIGCWWLDLHQEKIKLFKHTKVCFAQMTWHGDLWQAYRA